jgi:hypothetical protein
MVRVARSGGERVLSLRLTIQVLVWTLLMFDPGAAAMEVRSFE